MEPGTTRLEKLSDEIRGIWWAFGPADNRGTKVLELTERAKKLEAEHAELLALAERVNQLLTPRMGIPRELTDLLADTQLLLDRIRREAER